MSTKNSLPLFKKLLSFRLPPGKRKTVKESKAEGPKALNHPDHLLFD